MKLTIALQSTKRYWLMILYLIILGLSSVSAVLNPTPIYTNCYQETANASHINDGLCNLKYTGTYTFDGTTTFYQPEATYDGIWTTGTFPYGANPLYVLMDINYTKPFSATGANWTIKYYNGLSMFTPNYTLPNDCFSFSNQTLSVRIKFIYNDRVYFYCYNGTWNLFNSSTNGIVNLREEAITWELPSLIENNQTYLSSVQSSTTNKFSLNVSYDPNLYTSISANLIYNGTIYSSTLTRDNLYNIFTTYVTTPYTVNQLNISFYWNISITNSTGTYYYTTSQINQSISGLNVDDCTINKILVMNFTNKDQDSLSSISNSNYSIYVKIGNPSLTTYANYSINKTGSSLAVCINSTPTGTYRMDYVMQWGLTNYFTQYYNVQNYTLTNSTLGQNITLYSLISSGNEQCQINLKDNTFNPLTNAVLQIERQYINRGTYYTTEIPLTDSSGGAVGHFITTGSLYNIYVKRNNQLIATINNVNPYTDTNFGPCTLTYNIPASSTNPTTVSGYYGVYYSNQNYNTETNTYSFSFSSADGNTHTVLINGYILDNYQNISVCSQTITSTSGTPACAVSTTYMNKTIIFRAYSDDNLLFTDYGNSGYKHNNILSKTRYIIAALLIPAAVLMAGGAASVGVIAFIMGLILCSMIFLIDTQSIIGAGSFIVWFIIAGIILIIKIVAGGVKNG